MDRPCEGMARREKRAGVRHGIGRKGGERNGRKSEREKQYMGTKRGTEERKGTGKVPLRQGKKMVKGKR